MADVKYVRKETDEELDNVPIDDGQLLFTGEGHTFVDFNTVRIPMQNTPDSQMSSSSTNSVSNNVIKNYVDTSINNLDNTIIKSEVLWENVSPTTSFTTLTINLANNDYDILEFYYKYNTDSDYIISTKTLKGYGLCLTELVGENFGYGARRMVNRISDLTYEVQAPSGNSIIENPYNYIIPLYVIGYKNYNLN